MLVILSYYYCNGQFLNGDYVLGNDNWEILAGGGSQENMEEAKVRTPFKK